MPLFDYPTAPVTMEDVRFFAMGAETIVHTLIPQSHLEVAEPAHPQQSMVKVIIVLGRARKIMPWAFVDLDTGLIYAVNEQGTPGRFPRGTITTAAYGAEYVTPLGPLEVRDLVA